MQSLRKPAARGFDTGVGVEVIVALKRERAITMTWSTEALTTLAGHALQHQILVEFLDMSE